MKPVAEMLNGMKSEVNFKSKDAEFNPSYNFAFEGPELKQFLERCATQNYKAPKKTKFIESLSSHFPTPLKTFTLQYTDNSWNFGGRNTTIINPTSYSQRKKESFEEEKVEKKGKIHWGAAALGAAVIFGSIYALGKVLLQYGKDHRKYNETLLIKDTFQKCSFPNSFDTNSKIEKAKRELQICLLNQEALDKKTCEKTNMYALSCLGILTGGSSFLIGGLFGGLAISTALIGLGVVATVAGIAGCIFNWTIHSEDDQSLQADRAKSAANHLLRKDNGDELIVTDNTLMYQNERRTNTYSPIDFLKNASCLYESLLNKIDKNPYYSAPSIYQQKNV